MRPRLISAFCDVPFAHRGLHNLTQKRPENSLGAVNAALALGYGVEIDVQLSADGEAVVFHDDDLDRMTRESGLVSAKTAQELEQLCLADTAERIVRLCDVVQAVQKAPLPILIELKKQPDESATQSLAKAAAQALSDAGPYCAVMSFDPRLMGYMQTLAPEVPRGLTSEDFMSRDNYGGLAPEAAQRLSAVEDFEAVEASFISYRWQDLPQGAVTTLREAGWPVFCWTITNERDARKVAPWVDSITFEQYLAQMPAVT